MNGVTDIKRPSVGKLVEGIYDTMTPGERAMFDQACERFQMRPATMIRRQINAIIENNMTIDTDSRAAFLRIARERQYTGLAVLIDNISGFELLTLMDAIRRANETLDADK